MKPTALSSCAAAVLVVAAMSLSLVGQAPAGRVTVFEGARLITGDGSAAIENSAFIVENNQFTRVGPRGQVQVPAGAARVDLTGKTVMPAKVDTHGHIGFQHDWDGTMAKEYYTRENLIDHLQRLAYFGIGGTVSMGDLIDRSDLKGGRTGWGDVPLRVANEVIPGAALFRTAGPGIAWPGSGAQGHPSRSDVPYPVTTVEQAREATRDYVRMKPAFIKIWVDTRNGSTPTLTPPLYLAIIEEAHKAGVPVGAHNVTLSDAKILMKAGVDGWLHPPVRGGEVPDEAFLGMIRERIAQKNRPNMWFNGMAGTGAASREDWDDPLLRETISPQQIQAQVGEQLAKVTPDTVARARANLRTNGVNSIQKLRAAGMKLVLGGDTGQTRFFIGWSQQLEFEHWIHMGLTPMEAIVAATRDSAAAVGLNTGMVAAGKNADFIVLDANPLDNIANSRRIHKVYLRGQEVDRAGMRARWQARWKTTATR
jgi:imidazolonepropionase-like amidohydrolase